MSKVLTYYDVRNTDWWDRWDETVSKSEIGPGNEAGLVQRGSLTAENEGTASGAPTPRISANFETVSSCPARRFSPPPPSHLQFGDYFM
jgi:hypothetical protein